MLYFLRDIGSLVLPIYVMVSVIAMDRWQPRTDFEFWARKVGDYTGSVLVIIAVALYVLYGELQIR